MSEELGIMPENRWVLHPNIIRETSGYTILIQNYLKAGI